VLLGIAVTVTGIILLLDRIGGAHEAISLLWQWWPLAIVLVGAWNLVRFISRPWSFWGPVIVMLSGSLILLATTDSLPDEASRFGWPALLVALGLVIALIDVGRPERGGQWIRERAILRGKRSGGTNELLRYGKATAIFGHLVVDLTRSAIEEKPRIPTELNIIALCGHVEVLVPVTWRVRLHREVGIGARIAALPGDGATANGHGPPLDVHVLGVFGGAELRRG
jgi:hypothetical protein